MKQLHIGYFTTIIVAVISLSMYGCDFKKRHSLLKLQKEMDAMSEDSLKAYPFEKATEIDNAIAIKSSHEVLYSKNVDGKLVMFSYNSSTGREHIQLSGKGNVSKPFLFNDDIFGIEELQNKLEFRIICKEGISTFTSYSPEKIYNSRTGRYVIIKYKDNDSLYFWDSKGGSARILADITEIINGISFSEERGLAIISTGEDLILLKLDDLTLQKLLINIPGTKLNPYLQDNAIYFASNGESEFYQIYRYGIVSNNCTIILKAKNDLRLPKIEGNLLYYLELIGSKYLLRCLNLATRTQSKLTEDGIIYNYEISNGNIYYVYSDLRTPRCLKFYDIDLKKTFQVGSKSMDLGIQAIFSPETATESPAYLLESKSLPLRGVILYFHPGKNNDDYSPRWDNMIMPFCVNGYIVVAPNFPTSIGYGKSHAMKSFDKAVLDMNNWKKRLKRDYPNVPLYYFGSSSGCILMDASIAFDSTDIKAAISAFGLTSNFETYNIPTCYILGKHDPIVNFEDRSLELAQLAKQQRPVVFITLQNEKHWIEKSENFYVIFPRLFRFLEYSNKD